MKYLLTPFIVFLLSINGYFQAFKAQGKLEVMVVPPAPALNWKNPTTLTLGFLRSYVQKTYAKKIHGRERSAMGHGIVRAFCSTGEDEVDFWSGFSGNDNNRGVHLLLGGAGLSILAYSFHDGYIQSTEFVNKYLNDVRQQPEIKAGFIRINVSQEQCKLIKEHFEEFRQNGTENLIYGFFTDPLSVQGAGCTSYATSFAQKSGVFPSFLEENWTRTVEISKRNMGPTDQVNTINGFKLKPVSFLRLINPLRPLTWRSKNDKVIRFSFIDPQLMSDFMRQSIECLEDPARCINRPDLMNWLKEHKANISSNEYIQGIEISLD